MLTYTNVTLSENRTIEGSNWLVGEFEVFGRGFPARIEFVNSFEKGFGNEGDAEVSVFSLSEVVEVLPDV